MFKVGDRVKCVGVYGQDSASNHRTQAYFSAINKSEEYTVTAVKEKLGINFIRISGQNPDYFYPVNCFELVRAVNNVSVYVEGKVVNRSAETVTVQTDDGESILLPARLVPLDPRLLKLREIAKVASVRPESIERGEYDEWLSPFLENINVS